MLELGASEAPSVLGCGFKTPYRLWLEKSGLVPEEDETNEIMEAGTALQSAVLGLFLSRLGGGWVVWKEEPELYHLSKPWMRATPDAVLLRYERGDDSEATALVEIKCVTGQVPPVPRVPWLIQCLHQRIVYETESVHLSQQFLVAFGGLRLVWWEIPRHQAAMDRVLREEERFLAMVESGTPPPLRAEDASVLHARWPWSKPETVTLDAPEVLNADLIYRQATAEIAALQQEQAKARAVIEAAMGPAESARLANGSEYTWRTSRRKEYTVKAGTLRMFKAKQEESE